MKNILAQSENIHCIGIKGAGLSALAGLLRGKGKVISGSDSAGSGHNAQNITPKIQLVLYSSAIPEENVERMAAHSMGIPQLSYPEALGLLTEEYKTVAICGTHGKTTTTAMTATVLKNLIDPTILVGASVPELDNKNYREGKGEYLIIEACEYQRHFLHYTPTVVVLTNIEIDHLDYFQDEADYLDAFNSFLLRIVDSGTIIANKDDTNVQKVCEWISKERPDVSILTYGKESVMFKEFNLSIPGNHNKYNATAAFRVSENITKIHKDEALEALNNFKGTGRRFEQFLRSNGQIIIDDYAHHPTAIRATLKAAREKFGPDKKILCVFQPHQYSRTIKLLKDFTLSFSDADEVIIPNIYQVRDTDQDIQNMSPEKFVQEISKHHPATFYGHGFEKTFQDIQNRIDEFDVIITMGAGDITKLNEKLKSSSK